MPVVLGALALGVDYGSLTFQKRKLQKTADLAAIVAAGNINDPERAVAEFFSLNGEAIAVETEKGLLIGKRFYGPEEMPPQVSGVARLSLGNYTPDPAASPTDRFMTGSHNPEAVRVTIRRSGLLYFAHIFAQPPELTSQGTAAIQRLAGFSVGSRIASLNGGILNAVLGRMLGSNVSLRVMDYRALLDADVDLLTFMDLMATELNLTAVTYAELLQQSVTLPTLLHTLRLDPSIPQIARSALAFLETASNGLNTTVQLGRLVNLEPYLHKKVLQSQIDGSDHPSVLVSAFELASTAAAIANGESQIRLGSALNLPGLASVDIGLVIGEPPVGTPPHAFAPAGTVARTAQTRLKVDITLAGQQVLAGTTIRIPLYLELAYAEAQLKDIHCNPAFPNKGSAIVSAAPGLVEIAVGEVDTAALSTFSEKPRVSPAQIVLMPGLIRIDGKAHVESRSQKPTDLRFSSLDIAASRVKSIESRDLVSSATKTLFQELELDISVLGLSLGIEPLARHAVITSLTQAAPAIDMLLSNLLAIAGVKVGEADIRVSGVQCKRPVLVQ